MRISLVQSMNRTSIHELASRGDFSRAEQPITLVENREYGLEDGGEKFRKEMLDQSLVYSTFKKSGKKPGMIAKAQVSTPTDLSNQHLLNTQKPLEQLGPREMMKSQDGFSRYPAFKLKTGHAEDVLDDNYRVDLKKEVLIGKTSKKFIDKQHMNINWPAKERFQLYVKSKTPLLEPPLECGRVQNQCAQEKDSQFKDPNLNVIRITYSQTTALTQKSVVRIFRRFGRIDSLTFDQDRQFWTIQYRFAKEAFKASKGIALDKLFGYRFFEGDGPRTPFSFIDTRDTLVEGVPEAPCLSAPHPIEIVSSSLDIQYSVQFSR